MICSLYDYDRERWISRPSGVRWSQMVLGRRAVQRHILKTRCVTVSVYRTLDGRLFYTDPVSSESKPGPGVLYRIRVRLRVGTTAP